jgi:Holliday junction resolvase
MAVNEDVDSCMTDRPEDQSSPSQGPRLGRTAQPFRTADAAHTIVKVADQLGWDMGNIDKFTRRVQHVEYGLSAEIEFAAILRWLGWCSFVHRLSEDVLEDEARSQWTVPDLLAVFQTGGDTCSAVIEVKTTEDKVLRFKAWYLKRLKDYAALLNQPLLIAWRPRAVGFWILFDPAIAEPAGEDSVTVDFEQAIKNDLMSVFAGDYYLVPKQGAGLRIELERVGEKEPTADGYQAVFRVSDAYLHDAAGERGADVPNALVWAIFSTLTDHQEINDDVVVQSFVASGGMTRAQLVLRTAVGFSLDEDERIHWKQVGTNLDAILRCDDLLRDAQAYFGTFMSYIFHQQPQITPSFLPGGWAGRSAGSPAESEDDGD